jgi:hypothetical protein
VLLICQTPPHLPAVARVQRLERLVAAGPDVVGAVVEPLQLFFGSESSERYIQRFDVLLSEKVSYDLYGLG